MNRIDPSDLPPVPSPADAPPKKLNLAVLLILAAVFVTVPVCLFALVYFWLTQSAFNSIDELKADDLQEIEIRLVNLPRGPQNRPDPSPDERLKAGENTRVHADPDVDPTLLTRPDFDVFLSALRGAEKVERTEVPAVAYLGKVEVRYKDGRRGTVLLKQSDTGPANNPTVMVWMNINSHWYRGGTLKELRAVAQPCAERGTKAK
jgi:hypothetical protein